MTKIAAIFIMAFLSASCVDKPHRGQATGTFEITRTPVLTESCGLTEGRIEFDDGFVVPTEGCDYKHLHMRRIATCEWSSVNGAYWYDDNTDEIVGFETVEITVDGIVMCEAAFVVVGSRVGDDDDSGDCDAVSGSAVDF